MKIYEYTVATRPRDVDGRLLHDREMECWLNEYGTDGWDLCAVLEDKYGASEFFFKRELDLP